MRLAIDTNRYGDLASGEASVVDAVHGASAVFIPFIVLAELRAGFSGGSRARQNEAFLAKVFDAPHVTTLYPDDTTTRHYAVLYQQLRRQGTPMPTNDLWIAALVIQNNLTLTTRDRHFDHLPQISRI
jgi:tRNA(fMet)-specific endonuclease VapC